MFSLIVVLLISCRFLNCRVLLNIVLPSVLRRFQYYIVFLFIRCMYIVQFESDRPRFWFVYLNKMFIIHVTIKV